MVLTRIVFNDFQNFSYPITRTLTAKNLPKMGLKHKKSLFNGVPMIGIPLMFDQFYIANRLRDINMGLKLLPQDVTPESVIESINEILSGDYQETARQFKFKMENQPKTDLERALNELEYLMKIKNFDHLKPQKIRPVLT